MRLISFLEETLEQREITGKNKRISEFLYTNEATALIILGRFEVELKNFDFIDMTKLGRSNGPKMIHAIK